MAPAPPRGFVNELARFRQLDSWVARCGALDARSASRSEVSRRLLVWALTEDPHEFVRQKACEILGARRERAGFEGLVRALAADPKPYNRRLAAKALGELGDPEAVPHLLALVRDPACHGDPLHGALQALGVLGDRRATAPILDRLRRTRDGTTRFACLDALAVLADPGANAALLEYAHTHHGRSDYPHVAVRAVAASGDPGALVGVLGCVKRAGVPAVSAAAAVLGTTTSLTALLRSTRGKAREAVVIALGERGQGDAVPALVEELGRSRSATYRRILLATLERLGWEPDAEDEELVVLGLLEKRAWKAIVARGGPAVPVLVRAFAGLDRYRKPKLLECLGRIGDPAAGDLCRRAAGARDVEVRNAAAVALAELGDRASVPTLVKSLDAALHREPYRHPAGIGEVRALGALGDPRAEGALTRALADGPGVHRAALRANAVDALGRLGTLSATATLVAALSDRDRDLRRRALRTLEGSGWRPSAGDQVVAALLAAQDWGKVGDLTPEELALLVGRFPGESRWTQEALAPALAATGATVAVGPLLDWLFRPALALFAPEARARWEADLAPLFGSWSGAVVTASSAIGRREEPNGSRAVTYHHDLDDALAATDRLAASASPLATHLLHRIAGKGAISVTTWETEEWGSGGEDLDCAPQRARAAAALAARGDPAWDPEVALQGEAWAQGPGT